MDLIDRQAAIDEAEEYEKQLREILGDENELAEVVKILKHRLIALPSAQQKIKKGRWVKHNGLPLNDFCSCCAKDSPYNKHWDFCPNCGADMRGE